MASVVAVSDVEQQTGVLSNESVAQLRTDLAQRGFCSLGPGLFPHAVLDRLETQLDLFAAQLAAQEVLDRPGSERYWHMNGGIPRTRPFVDAAIFTNPLVEHAVAALLGPGCFLSFCGGNLNATCPSSGDRRRWATGDTSDLQFLHADGPFIYPTAEIAARVGQPQAHSTTAVVVNFGTSDITAATGATEIWPGSHMIVPAWTTTNSRGDITSKKSRTRRYLADVASELLQAGVAMPPVPMEVPKGGCVIRDIRIWHRGVHNPSERPRHQVALCYSAARVREETIVNSTALRDLCEKPRRPESELTCAGGFSPPLPKLRFSASCNEIFATASLHNVDRNVQLVSDPELDSWGQPVASLAVSPQHHEGKSGSDSEWSFIARASFNHFHKGATSATTLNDGATRRRVSEAELPAWATAAFKQEQLRRESESARL